MKTSFLKTGLFSLALLLTVWSMSSCDGFGVRASGDLVTETFDETNFRGLELNVKAEAEVRIDSVFKVEITCEESAMPYVETSVTGGVLRIRFSRNVYDVDHMKVIVSAPSWDYFDLSGSGTIKVNDPITGTDLHLEVSGSGSLLCREATFNHTDIDLSGSGTIKCVDAAFKVTDLKVSGSGEIDLEGSGDDLYGKISGSGDVDCLDFPVKNARVDISGSGNFHVNASETLTANISGSGNVYYEGNPQINTHISGSGNIKKY